MQWLKSFSLDNVWISPTPPPNLKKINALAKYFHKLCPYLQVHSWNFMAATAVDAPLQISVLRATFFQFFPFGCDVLLLQKDNLDSHWLVNFDWQSIFIFWAMQQRNCIYLLVLSRHGRLLCKRFLQSRNITTTDTKSVRTLKCT